LDDARAGAKDTDDFIAKMGSMSIYFLLGGFMLIQALLVVNQVTIDEALVLQTSYASILGPIIAPIIAHYFSGD